MVRHCRNSLKENKLTRTPQQFHGSPHFNLSTWGQMASFPPSDTTLKAPLYLNTSPFLWKLRFMGWSPVREQLKVKHPIWQKSHRCLMFDLSSWTDEVCGLQVPEIIPAPWNLCFFTNVKAVRGTAGNQGALMLLSWEKSPLGAAMQVSPRVINCGGDQPHIPKEKVKPSWCVLWPGARGFLLVKWEWKPQSPFVKYFSSFTQQALH